MAMETNIWYMWKKSSSASLVWAEYVFLESLVDVIGQARLA